MRVLHVASFQGNIGDGANHSGFRACFRAAFGKLVSFTNFEIRQTYWGESDFDNDLVRESNSHDLVIVGGGNFFELYVEKSRTGSTFDVPPKVLERISTPIIFNGLGCDGYKGSTIETVSRFKAFLDYVLTSSRCAVSVRNDGSMSTIERIFGPSYASRIYPIADCGFFLDLPGSRTDKSIIAVNVAADMPEFRYDMHARNSAALNSAEAMSELASALTLLAADNVDLRIVFVPHIYSDIDAISSVLHKLPDSLRRRRVDIAQYESTVDGYNHAFDIYRSAKVVLSMRFHATVCSIGMGRPVVCMTSYPKMADTLREIGLEDIGVELYLPGCGGRIAALATNSMARSDQFARQGAELRSRLWDVNLEFYRAALKKVLA
jgi:polysaccharide pyruvyl transferase WcaK-like protein